MYVIISSLFKIPDFNLCMYQSLCGNSSTDYYSIEPVLACI